MNFILNKIRELNNYIEKYYLKIFFALFIIYILSAVITYFVVLSFPKEKMTEIAEMLKEIYQTETLMKKQGMALCWGLFVNNLKVSGIGVISAVIPFLFYPLWLVVTNGIAFGMVFAFGAYMGINNMAELFLKFVLPHGIFEIPVFILSCAIGFRFCLLIIKKLFKKAGDECFGYHLNKLSEILVVYIIPFLFLAAFIEGVLEPLVFRV